MTYDKQNFKIPVESDDYQECSEFVIKQIQSILKKALTEGRNKILIHTNLRLGLPMENINKVAGPFVEAWAFEVFHDAFENEGNVYSLINVEAQERLNMADVLLQFKRKRKHHSSITAAVDVKATAEDFENSGRSPAATQIPPVMATSNSPT